MQKYSMASAMKLTWSKALGEKEKTILKQNSFSTLNNLPFLYLFLVHMYLIMTFKGTWN